MSFLGITRRPDILPAASVQADAASLVNAHLASLVADHMDILTLTTWRSTCRANYIHASNAFRRSLLHIILPFVPRASEFVRLLTDCHGAVGGEAALAFVLRALDMDPPILEVFVDRTWFEIFVDLLCNSPTFAPIVRMQIMIPLPENYVRNRLARRRAVFSGRNGRYIYIYESTTMSPCSPISRTWTSSLMNFVTEHSYGCAYPSLTLSHRGLLSDVLGRSHSFVDLHARQRLEGAGFTFHTSPNVWERRGPTWSSSTVLSTCLRRAFICPDQARMFQDRGSLVGLLDPLQVGPATLRRRFVPPYGPMPVWRMWSSNHCDSGCASFDPVLPSGVVSVLALEPLLMPVPEDDRADRTVVWPAQIAHVIKYGRNHRRRWTL